MSPLAFVLRANHPTRQNQGCLGLQGLGKMPRPFLSHTTLSSQRVLSGLGVSFARIRPVSTVGDGPLRRS